eukprot:752985-Hanusia_phi.AAC.3
MGDRGGQRAGGGREGSGSVLRRAPPAPPCLRLRTGGSHATPSHPAELSGLLLLRNLRHVHPHSSLPRSLLAPAAAALTLPLASLSWCSSEAPSGSLQQDIRRLQRSTAKLLEVMMRMRMRMLVANNSLSSSSGVIVVYIHLLQATIKQAEQYAKRPLPQLEPEQDDDW